MKRCSRLRNWIAGLSFLLLISMVASCWFVGGRLVRPAQRTVGPPPAGVDHLAIETVSIPSQSGANLAGWWIEHEHPTATVVLLHPIRADRRAMLGRAMLLYQAGYSTLLVDLQAHGESPGDAITMGSLERFDAQAAVAYVRSRHGDQPVGVIGWSLGGAAALLGSPLPIDAMIVESVYPTIEEATDNRVAAKLGVGSKLITPMLLAQLGPRLNIQAANLQPIDYVPQVGCPLLVLGGDRDYHTTLEETGRMYKAAKEPRQLQIFSGAGHEDLLRFDSELYQRTVLAFFRRSFRGS